MDSMLRGTTGGKGITGEFGSVGPQPLYRNTQTGAIVPGGGQPCPGCEVHRNRGGVIAFNIISGNNYLGCGAAENAALKVHGFSGEVVGNLIVENFGAHAGICIPLSVDSHSSRARAQTPLGYGLMTCGGTCEYPGTSWSPKATATGPVVKTLVVHSVAC